MKKLVYGVSGVALVVFGIMFLSGFFYGPPKLEILETIETNQEAFMVPLEADTSQQGHIGGLKLMEDQAAKVTTQRVSISQRSTVTGYMPWDYKWIPTEDLITVETSQVNRQWDGKNGQQALEIESMDSIEVSLPATIACYIARGDGAKFRYYFSGQTLDQVIDTEVHGFMQTKSSDRFGRLDLADVNAKMDPIGVEILEEARKYFAVRGITIEYFGWIGGVQFGNPAIQQKIDELYVAENDQLIALQEQQVAIKNNAIKVSKAEAERDAALTAYGAREATLLAATLKIKTIEAQTIKEAATRLDGTLPRTLPANSGLLFGLDRPSLATLPESVVASPAAVPAVVKVPEAPAAAPANN